MIKWSQLPLSDLTIAATISIETAGFISNKYSLLHGCAYMLSIVFIMIYMISLDAVKTKSKYEEIEPKNNVIPVQIEPKLERTIESRQWFWQSA